MDAFYAAVEQLDDASLRGRPILVGPNSERGVVLTASYEARPFGVGSAMPIAIARRLCPEALIVPPRFERYQAISETIMNVFADFSPHVEALSLDEAFLDMTGAARIFGDPSAIGRKIKAAVRDATGLTASVGVASTKYVAKVASGFAKPDGLTTVGPDEAVMWLAPMPVSRLWGAGKKTTPRLEALGLHTIGDVAAADLGFLIENLGGAGSHFYALAHARDPRRVARTRLSKSVGSDRTLSRDISARRDILVHLRRSADSIGKRLRAKGYVARGVRVKLKTTQFELLTRQHQLTYPTDVADVLYTHGAALLDAFDHPGPFRLVGMAAYDLIHSDGARQIDLFDADDSVETLEHAIDDLIARFGRNVVVRARDLAHPESLGRVSPNLDFLDVPADDD